MKPQRTFQHYEVTVDGLRWWPEKERALERRFRGNQALSRAMAYAQQITEDYPAMSRVEAVYRVGATGRHVESIAGYLRGTRSW